MEKPIYLRDETWSLVLAYTKKAGVHPINEEQPGRLAYKAGIIRRPELLRGTVIELDDEVTYLIDAAAAQQLRASAPAIILLRLGDHKKKTATFNEVCTAVRDGAVFDQLDLDA